MKNKKLSQMGLLIALAFLLSYIEVLIPFPMIVPGMKVGLANIVIIYAMYVFGMKEAIVLSILRMVLVAFTFGNLYSLLYSLAGAVCSLLIMAILKRTEKFSAIGVSLSGAVMHNVGQIFVAIIVIDTVNLIYILPILALTGIATGIVIGTLATILIKQLSKIE
ncbi:Gx transporter family protein [Anaerosporobacter sp.]|uniref:Gx transporter family protein n=1 Tax=Anaerosporobacter sp. TaxID=1872529 RepID=UPI00286EB97E|nr:Gx transporter family protein [Anaerosporobacter sp.]